MKTDKPKSAKEAREARLAQALRTNLRRRKGLTPPPAPSDAGNGEGQT